MERIVRDKGAKGHVEADDKEYKEFGRLDLLRVDLADNDFIMMVNGVGKVRDECKNGEKKQRDKMTENQRCVEILIKGVRVEEEDGVKIVDELDGGAVLCEDGGVAKGREQGQRLCDEVEDGHDGVVDRVEFDVVREIEDAFFHHPHLSLLADFHGLHSHSAFKL